jgi:long-chain acyl-CoA synthetase
MNLAHVLQHGLSHNSEKIAFEGDGRAFSYAQVAQLSEHLAASLQALGYLPGHRIAVMLPNIPEYALVMYGLWRMGVEPVLVNPQLTGRELLYILQDSLSKAIIVPDALLPVLEPLRPELKQLAVIVLGTSSSSQDLNFAQLIGTPGQHPILERSLEDTAQIFYTSGTTGNPKGAMLSHGNLWANAKGGVTALQVSPEDRLFCILPVFHAFAFTAALVIVPLVGGAVNFEYRYAPKKLMEHLSDPRLSVMVAVPSLLGMFLRFPQEFKLSPALRCILSGGGPLSPQLEIAFSQRFGDIVRQGYGLTECSPYAAVNPFQFAPKLGSIGTVFPGGELAVRDLVSGAFLAPGKVGELVVRGPHVFKGYWNHPEATTEAFVDHWLRTGDLGYQDEDGYFFIVDRLKDMIIVGGENVYSREVEDVLMGLEPLREVAVVGDPDPDKGEVVHAYVSLKEGMVTTEAEVIAYARKFLTAIKVPKYVTFLDELPKSATGKILKRQLRRAPSYAPAEQEREG